MAVKKDTKVLTTYDIKYAAFVDAYLTNGFNMTKAYQTVYPECKYNSAGQSGFEYMTKPEVQEILKSRQAELKKKNDRIKDKLIQNLMDIIDMNMSKPSQHRTAIKAIEVLNRMHGFNEPDRMDLSSNGEPLQLRDLIVFGPAIPESTNANGVEVQELLPDKNNDEFIDVGF